MVTPKNSNALMAAVAQAPVTIALRASNTVFRYYKSGIITSTTCGTTVDHAVIAVGYGTENGVDYWLIRNSWGTSWGESGYVKIKRDRTTTSVGICAIYYRPSYTTY